VETVWVELCRPLTQRRFWSTATDVTGLFSGRYQKQLGLRCIPAANFLTNSVLHLCRGLNTSQRLVAENASRERAGKWATVAGETAPAAAAVPYQEGARMQVRFCATDAIFIVTYQRSDWQLNLLRNLTTFGLCFVIASLKPLPTRCVHWYVTLHLKRRARALNLNIRCFDWISASITLPNKLHGF
jgi:hypothetical protein